MQIAVKRFLKITAGLVGLLLIIFASYIAYAVIYGPELNSSSRNFVTSEFPKLATSNFNFLSNDLEQNKPCNAAVGSPKSNEMLNRLGAFKNITSTNGSFVIAMTPDITKMVSANYVVGAVFENATANVQIKVVKTHGAWQFKSINIVSTVFSGKNG